MSFNDDLAPDERRLAAAIKAAYQPYRAPDLTLGRRRPIRMWLASFAAVAAVVVVGAVVLRPPSALATWTREPTSSELEAMTDVTEDACQDQAARRLRVGSEARWPDDPAMREVGGLPLVAYDQRGEASAALFGDEQTGSVAICVIIPVNGQPDYVELTAATESIPEEFGPVSVWMAAGGSNSDYGSRWEIAGRIGSGVEKLVIVRSDGERVTATLDSGWFLAWWPHWSVAARMEVTVDGVVETIDLGGRYDSGGPPCRVSLFDGWCVWSF